MLNGRKLSTHYIVMFIADTEPNKISYMLCFLKYDISSHLLYDSSYILALSLERLGDFLHALF